MPRPAPVISTIRLSSGGMTLLPVRRRACARSRRCRPPPARPHPAWAGPVPDVDHGGPLLDRRRHAGRQGTPAEHERVVQQDLVAAYLDQQGREIVQVGEERRDQRRLAIATAHVGLRHELDALASDDRIGAGRRGVAGAAAREIDPRRDADAARRPRQRAVAQREQRGHGEAATGGVAGHDDPVGGDALRLQPLEGGQGIVERGGERMLGSQAVVEQERLHAGCPRDRGGEMTVRAGRADHVAAAVEIRAPRHRCARPVAAAAAAGRVGVVTRSIVTSAGVGNTFSARSYCLRRCSIVSVFDGGSLARCARTA